MNGFVKYEADVEVPEFGEPGEMMGELSGNELSEPGPPLTEMDEMEFATELLDVTNEAEMGRVLAGLLGRIARRGQRQGRRGNWLRLVRNSPLARNLMNALRNSIRQ